MNTFLSHPAVQAIGWALVHFIWQGLLLAAILFLTNRITQSPGIRYATGCAVMVAMPAIFLATILRTEHPAPSAAYTEAEPFYVSKGTNPGVGYATVVASAPIASPTHDLSPIPGWIACLWLMGVAALSIVTAAGWLRIQQLTKRGTEPANPAWLEAMETLKRRLKISKPVRLCISAIAEVPSVIGWLRPCILVPISALTGLEESQLRAILAHELAHIRRHDYLINLLQNAIETLLFYHPAVWRISRQIRQERELCCDDLAVELCGDVMLYATALTQLEQLRGHTSELALAATGGDLLARIRRLMGKHDNRGPGRITGSIAALTTTVLVVAAVIGIDHAPAIHAQSPPPKTEQAAPPPAARTTPIETPQAQQPPITLAQAKPQQAPTSGVRAGAPQPPANSATNLEFEVATIKPLDPSRGFPPGIQGGPGTSDPERISFASTLKGFVMAAYGVGNEYISGPAWLDTNPQLYVLTATIRPGATKEQVSQMLQNLLHQRFQLTMHRETRDVPLYELTVAGKAPQLKEYVANSYDDGNAAGRPAGGGPYPAYARGFPEGLDFPYQYVSDGINHSVANKVSIAQLVKFLSLQLKRPVVDKTGLTGLYNYNLDFMPVLPVTGDLSTASAPDFITAVRVQLGMKLTAKKDLIEMIVIDRAEKTPIEN